MDFDFFAFNVVDPLWLTLRKSMPTTSLAHFNEDQWKACHERLVTLDQDVDSTQDILYATAVAGLPCDSLTPETHVNLKKLIKDLATYIVLEMFFFAKTAGSQCTYCETCNCPCCE
jgi:hypothetical protein